MFTQQELQIILDALALARASAKRGLNTHPGTFKPIYEQMLTDIHNTTAKVLEMKAK